MTGAWRLLLSALLLALLAAPGLVEGQHEGADGLAAIRAAAAEQGFELDLGEGGDFEGVKFEAADGEGDEEEEEEEAEEEEDEEGDDSEEDEETDVSEGGDGEEEAPEGEGGEEGEEGPDDSEFMQDFDLSGDGKLSLPEIIRRFDLEYERRSPSFGDDEEMVEMLAKMKEELEQFKADMRSAFPEADINEDGFIDKKELRGLLKAANFLEPREGDEEYDEPPPPMADGDDEEPPTMPDDQEGDQEEGDNLDTEEDGEEEDTSPEEDNPDADEENEDEAKDKDEL